MPEQLAADVVLSFPELKPGEAVILAQELEQELLKANLRPKDLALARPDGEVMGADLATAIYFIGQAFTDVAVAHVIERIIGWFATKHKIFMVAKSANGETWSYGSAYRKGVETEPVNTAGVNYGVLGIVLLGASEFPAMDGLDNPVFARSAELVRHTLTSEFTLFHATKVLDLFNADISPVQVADRIEMFIDAHPDMKDLLIYYCGHGSFLRDRTYFLLLRTTRSGRESATGLKLRDLRYDLERRLIDKRLYLILDCCFAAEAAREFMSQNPQEFVQNQLAEAMPPSGWAVLAAASRSMPAMAPAGHPYTMFTGALAQALREGAPYLQHHFSLSDLAVEMRRRIVQTYGHDRAVFPQSHAPMQDEGDLTRVPLFENKAFDGVQPKLERMDDEIFEELAKQFQSPLSGIRKAALNGAYAFYVKTLDATVKNRVAAFLERAMHDDSREVSAAAAGYANAVRALEATGTSDVSLGESGKTAAAPAPSSPQTKAKDNEPRPEMSNFFQPLRYEGSVIEAAEQVQTEPPAKQGAQWLANVSYADFLVLVSLAVLTDIITVYGVYLPSFNIDIVTVLTYASLGTLIWAVVTLFRMLFGGKARLRETSFFEGLNQRHLGYFDFVVFAGAAVFTGVMAANIDPYAPVMAQLFLIENSSLAATVLATLMLIRLRRSRRTSVVKSSSD